MIVEIDEDIVKKCEDFAYAQLGTSKDLYMYRGETKKDKIVQDIIIGKMGEWAVYQLLYDNGYKPSMPDMNIYKGRRKSFDADITTKDYKIHVKSQGTTSAKRYGYSWLLQKTDKVTSEPAENEYFALVSVKGNECEILCMPKCSELLVYDIYGECKVPRYRHSKLALYLKDIQNYDDIEEFKL